MKRSVTTGLVVAGVASLAITAAIAGSGVGGVFNLGQVNTVNSPTQLRGAAATHQLSVSNGSTTTTATAILGQANAGTGVVGQSATRVGVRGTATSKTSENIGVGGTTQSPNGFAGYFRNFGETANPRVGRGIRVIGARGTDAIFPTTNFAGGGEFAGPNGVVGYPTFAGGAGLAGFSGSAKDAVGVYGASIERDGLAGLFRSLGNPGGAALRALGDGASDTVFASTRPAAGEFSGDIGVHAVAFGAFSVGVWADQEDGFLALWADGDTLLQGDTTNQGDLSVTGRLTKGSGTFKIDHPLDPENKYLSHSFVESPEMMNVYNGITRTDDTGLAVVDLPDYFEALNRDPRYQLTVIGSLSGSFVMAQVAQEVADNRFVIRTSEPGVKVSWQVTGIRRDAFAVKNPVIVEEEKAVADKGRYLHPQAFDQPASRGIGRPMDVAVRD